MSSSTSPWTAFTSPERGGDPGDPQRGSPFRVWQTAIAFPLLLALLIASAVAPLFHLFLNPGFGLTAGRPAPSMLGFAFVGLVGCWSARWLAPRIPNRVGWAAVSIGLWAASVGLWLALEPDYDLGAFLRDPGSLVHAQGYLVVPILLSFGAWWLGSRYGFDPGRFMPE
ncbi:MAG: hypothetical protein ACTHQE_13200, partial [Thermomicrobiales bacterium]